MHYSCIIKKEKMYRGMYMIHKITNTTPIAPLFDGWNETIIQSCIQGVMGEVYADDYDNPSVAMAILGDFCFIAGNADIELIKYVQSNYRRDYMLMIPQNRQWAEMIEAVYKERANKIERYAIKKETDIFNKEYLQQIVEKLPNEYRLQRIDENIYELCKKAEWSKDLVAQFTTYDSFAKLGLGFVITRGGEPASGASSYSAYNQGIEIEVDTRKDCRRQGLALVCSARLILECLDRGLYPSWDAHNMASVALAEKLGYNFERSYDAYEILK